MPPTKKPSRQNREGCGANFPKACGAPRLVSNIHRVYNRPGSKARGTNLEELALNSKIVAIGRVILWEPAANRPANNWRPPPGEFRLTHATPLSGRCLLIF